jgi:hypothetical protein
MLQWQKYNIRSPLNAVAADWAVKHRDELPVGDKDLSLVIESPVVTVKLSKQTKVGEK